MIVHEGAGANGNIVLMTTADVQSDRTAALTRMIRSVDVYRAANPRKRVDHYLLLQRCNDLEQECDKLNIPSWIKVDAVTTRLPLSAARNRMIDRAVAEVPDLEAAAVAFPDDDAWYPEGVLDHIARRFGDDRELDFWFCRYGTDAAMPSDVRETVPSLQTAIAKASSNTIVVRGRILRAIGGFDEALGLGTPAKSGEDTEFAIRSFLASRKVRFANVKMVGHRDFDRAIRAKYYGGTLVALGRHLPSTRKLAYPFIRKVLVGGALLAKRELTARELAAAYRLFRSNRPLMNEGAREARASDIRCTRQPSSESTDNA